MDLFYHVNMIYAIVQYFILVDLVVVNFILFFYMLINKWDLDNWYQKSKMQLAILFYFCKKKYQY